MKRSSETESGSDKEEKDEALMEKTSAENMEDREVRGDHEGKNLEGEFGVGGDNLAGVDEDDLMLDINGDDLFFTDDTFPSLPDFSCISSPILGSPSPSSASTCMHTNSSAAAMGGGAGGLFSSTSTSSSSSSSSSASWSFLQPPLDGGGCLAADMQQLQQEELEEDQPLSADGDFMMLVDPSLSAADHQSAAASEFSEAALDILNDMELLDMSLATGPWDPCSIFPDMDVTAAVDEIAASAIADQENSPPLSVQEGSLPGAEASDNDARAREEEEDSSDQDLSKLFLDWLKSNRDSISPEDLRTIKLKRSTIDCAARRLGGGKQAKMQLVKLILTWVQNNHLQKKRRRSRYQSADQPSGEPSVPGAFRYHQNQPQPPRVPINPNPNQFDYTDGGSGSDCTYAPSRMPYSFDLSPGAPMPGMMAAAAAYSGGGEMVVHPGAAAPSYCYSYNSSSGSNIVMDGQPFSPPPDFHPVDPSVGAWPPQFAAAPAQFAPFPCASAPLAMAPPPYAGLPNQFSGLPAMYTPQAGTFSATKEARKKRMARQRRYALQRNQNQKQVHHAHHHPHFAAAAFSDSSSRANPVEAAGSTASAAAAHANQRNWVIWSNLPNSGCNQMNPIMGPTDSSNTQKAAAAAPLPPQAPEQKQAQKQNSHRSSSSTTEQKRQGWKTEKNLKFLLQKVLKQSDVGSLGRIVLPKKEAETHLPELDARDGISIQMEDIGTNQVWNMRYRYWPNNKSRMYLLENTGDFVRTNGLQEGDFIVLYSDAKCSKYMIRGVKVRQGAAPEPRASSTTGGKNLGKAHLKVGIGSSKKKATCSSSSSSFFFNDEASP